MFFIKKNMMIHHLKLTKQKNQSGNPHYVTRKLLGLPDQNEWSSFIVKIGYKFFFRKYNMVEFFFFERYNMFELVL
jgi:hypothetical protein